MYLEKTNTYHVYVLNWSTCLAISGLRLLYPIYRWQNRHRDVSCSKITKPMNRKAKIWMQVIKFQNTGSELLFLLWEWLRAERLSPMPKTLASIPLLKKGTKITMRLLRDERGQMFYDASHRKMLNTVNGCSEETYDRRWLNPSSVSDSSPERPRNVRTTVARLLLSTMFCGFSITHKWF